MPSLSELPGEVKRSKLIKALERVGFSIDKTGGNGSHYKAVWPPSQKSVTIPYDIPKETLYYLLKELKQASGVTWVQIRPQL